MVQRMASCPVREHGRDQQHHDQKRQQPGRSKDQLFRQRQVNASDRKERQQNLPARLRLVNPSHRHSIRYGTDRKEPESGRDRSTMELTRAAPVMSNMKQ